MKKFMVIYYSKPYSIEEMADMKPEQMEEDKKKWFAWAELMGDSLLDFGAPLFNGTSLLKEGGTKPSTKMVSGYSFVQANDMDEAKNLLKNHPHYTYGEGCEIEIHECTSI